MWPSGFDFKAGRWEVLGSIPVHAYRSSLSEFSVVFFKTRVNMGQDPLERPHVGHYPPPA